MKAIIVNVVGDIGDKVFYIDVVEDIIKNSHADRSYDVNVRYEILECEICQIYLNLNKNHRFAEYYLQDLKGKFYFTVDGNNIFLTREAAEQHLKEKENEENN